MITKKPAPNFLPDLVMPLRDALRGVATLAGASEDMLEPAARLLPEPLRSRFRQALKSLEAAGKRLIYAPVDMPQIDLAARFLSASETGKPALEACAAVIVYAWEHLNEAGGSHRFMISETLVADRLTRAAGTSQASGVAFGADMLAALRQSSAIGLMPGLTRSIATTDETEVDLALLAIAVWLLSNRPDTVEAEEKLLDLSVALVRALQYETRTNFSDRGALERFLSETSSHL